VLPVERGAHHVPFDQQLLGRHVREQHVGHVTVVAAPVDVDRLRVVGQAQVLVDGRELQRLRVPGEIVGKVRAPRASPSRERSRRSSGAEDRQPSATAAGTGRVIEMMMTDDQLRDRFARRKRSRVIDHRLRLAARVHASSNSAR
jgi:hypothetical protein